MVTIASTPEKTLKTLTGEECIPLSDKTHIKTSILLSLSEQLNNAITKDEIQSLTMYRKAYDFSTETSINDATQDDTITFANSETS